MYSSVTPMPPWSWMHCWPTKRIDWPSWYLACAIARGRAAAIVRGVGIHAHDGLALAEQEKRDAVRIVRGPAEPGRYEERAGMGAGRHHRLLAGDLPGAADVFRRRRDVLKPISCLPFL